MQYSRIQLALYPKIHLIVYVVKISVVFFIFYNLYRILCTVRDDNVSMHEHIEVHKSDKHESIKSKIPLILLWNNYQETGNRVYKTIFHRITSGGCKATCRITLDKSKQNQSQAIVFHMPDLHWEGYNFPVYRDPKQPWVLMTYESANSVRQRCYYKGKYPIFDGRKLEGRINRTMTIREDSDIVIRLG